MKKVLIIYQSVHHKNTEKVAKRMAEKINADISSVNDINIDSVANYDIVGFGSGIFAGKFHSTMLKFINKLPEVSNGEAFVFSTSSFLKPVYNERIEKILAKKGYKILSGFSCKGFSTFGPFKLVGGKDKGRPDEKDLKNAEEYIVKIVK